MKKIYISLIISALVALIAAPCFSQEQKPMNKKNLKAGLCFSGGLFVIGSAIKIAQTSKPTPVTYNYEFEKRKNQNARLCNFFFIGAGLSLLTVSLDF